MLQPEYTIINRRKLRVLEVNGIKRPLIDWAKENGLKTQTIMHRLHRGATPEEAIKPPPRPGKPPQRKPLTPYQLASLEPTDPPEDLPAANGPWWRYEIQPPGGTYPVTGLCCGKKADIEQRLKKKIRQLNQELRERYEPRFTQTANANAV